MNNILNKGTLVENKANANLFTKPRRGCYEIKVGKGKYYVDILLNPSADINRAKHALLSQIPIHTTLNEADEGTYLWVYTDKGIAFNPVYSQLEFGTLHDNLARRIGASVVYLAGEIYKTDEDSYIYNILSGTYMMPLIKKCYTISCEEAQKKLMERTQKMFEDILDGEIQYDSKTLLKNATVPVTPDEINKYLQAGYDVYYFRMKKICEEARDTGDYSGAEKIDRGFLH
jgi:hypothetical protein